MTSRCWHEVAQVIGNERINPGIRRGLQYHLVRRIAQLRPPLVVRQYRLEQRRQLVQDRIDILDTQARRHPVFWPLQHVKTFRARTCCIKANDGPSRLRIAATRILVSTMIPGLFLISRVILKRRHCQLLHRAPLAHQLVTSEPVPMSTSGPSKPRSIRNTQASAKSSTYRNPAGQCHACCTNRPHPTQFVPRIRASRWCLAWPVATQ